MKTRYLLAIIPFLCFNAKAQDKLIDQALREKNSAKGDLYKVVVDHKERIYFDDLTECISKRGYLLVDAQTKVQFVFGEFRRTVSSFSFYEGEVSLKKFTNNENAEQVKEIDFVKLVNNRDYNKISEALNDSYYSGPISQLPYTNIPILNFLKKINFGQIISFYYDDNDNVIVSCSPGDDFLKVYHNFSLVSVYQNELVKKKPELKVNFSKDGGKITLTSEYFPKKVVVKLAGKPQINKAEMKTIMLSIVNQLPSQQVNVSNRKSGVQYYYVNNDVVAYNDNSVTKLLNTNSNQEVAMTRKYNLFSQSYDESMFYVSKGSYCEYLKINVNQWFSLYNDVQSYLQKLSETNDYITYTEFMLNLFDSKTFSAEMIESIHHAYYGKFKDVGVEKYQIEDRIFIAKNPDKKSEYNNYIENRKTAISDAKLSAEKIFKDYKEGFYIGEMKNNFREGRGIFVWKNFNNYNAAGAGRDFLIVHGIYSLRFEGLWSNDKPNGLGVIYYLRDDYGIIKVTSYYKLFGKFNKGTLSGLVKRTSVSPGDFGYSIEGLGSIKIGNLFGGNVNYYIYSNGKEIERVNFFFDFYGNSIYEVDDDNYDNYSYRIIEDYEVIKKFSLQRERNKYSYDLNIYFTVNNKRFTIEGNDKSSTYGILYNEKGDKIGEVLNNNRHSIDERKARELILKYLL